MNMAVDSCLLLLKFNSQSSTFCSSNLCRMTTKDLHVQFTSTAVPRSQSTIPILQVAGPIVH